MITFVMAQAVSCHNLTAQDSSGVLPIACLL